MCIESRSLQIYNYASSDLHSCFGTVFYLSRKQRVGQKRLRLFFRVSFNNSLKIVFIFRVITRNFESKWVKNLIEYSE